MTYATLMVNLEPGRPNTGLLRIAGALAERFDAKLIGIAVRQPMQIVYGDGCFVPPLLIDDDRAQIEEQIRAAEAEFHSAFQGHGGVVEWRSSVTFAMLSDYLAHETRSADLVITSAAAAPRPPTSRSVHTGDLVMQAGRPVLVVPATADELRLERAVIAWKDTREARRAVVDALPLLKQAAQVILVEIASEEYLAAARAHLDEVAVWLGRHGVVAEPRPLASTGDDAGRLEALARELDADILVAGAYGHSRLREWALGGVTRDLLLHASCCALVSH